MERRPLGRTGLEVSVLGFGASPLGEEFGPIDAAEGERAVRAAIDAGVNFFDTAPFYGRTLSEERLGKALAGRRDRVVLATKCCRYGLEDFDFSAARVESSIDESLARLRTDHVDVLYIHDVEFGDRRQVVEETIPAALRVKEAGKARAIGISGLQLELLAEIVGQVPVDVVLTYARYNLAITDAEDLLFPAAEQATAGVVNASPLLLGALTDQPPPEWHPADRELLATARRGARMVRSRGESVAAYALRYCLDEPRTASTLVGMSSRKQLQQNLEALNAQSDPEVLSDLRALLQPVGKPWTSGRPENWDAAVR